MPRIPEEEIDRLKASVSLAALVEASGVVLKPHGNNLLGLCPFHDDHEPSLVVTPDKNLWHCLGACQAGGSVIDWAMKWNGVSFRHAVELLRKDPTLAASSSRPLKISRVRRLPSPVSLDVEDQQLLNQVIGYYHGTLKQSPEALVYLEKRGLKNSEMVERFKLGYSNRTLGLRLPVKATKPGKEIRARLERLGLFRESGHEHFTGSLVVPVFDEHGNVTEVYGRKIRDDLKPGTPIHLYLPGPHQGIWNLEALHASKEIILCEALIDALTFWCAGYRNVTASYGVEGFTADHLTAMKKCGTERVLIAYDRDDAGEAAAQKLAEKLIAEGIDCYRLHFPKGMDANEYALSVQPAEKSLGVVIRAATWLGQGDDPSPSGGEPIVVPNEPQEETAAAPVTETVTPSTSSLTASPMGTRRGPQAMDGLLAASPITPPKADIEACVDGDTVTIAIGDRGYRVRGLAQNLSLNQLKVSILVRRNDAFHADQVELQSARQRAIFATQAAKELNVKEDVIHKDVGKLFLKLEELREKNIEQALTPKTNAIELSESEQQTALDLLRDPKLLDRLLADFHACGVVGEETNKLVGYLCTVSRKLDKPLAVIVQSTSAAGKSSLMDACLAFVPEEERIQYSAMTGQALFYMTSTDIQHKVLAISEEEGASRAAYALKLLQSEGRLTIASPAKDPETGLLETKPYHVEGPVMIFMTTTAIDIDDELLNRCLVLAVDENREQTRAIHQLQREAETLEGLIAREERSHLLKLHQNAQRLLRPLTVVNPYARQLTFPDTATRTRRDHMKYLALIRAIALVHQHQRAIQTTTHRGEAKEYIEATLDDIEVANRLAHDVLGRTLDELPPQTRRLLLLLDQLVRAACEKQKMDRPDYRFSRREVREVTQWGDTQLRLHLDRLVELEYVLVHRGGRGQSFVYELLYDGQGQDGKPFVPGLIDVEKLRSMPTTKSSRGSEGQFAGSSRGQRGPIAGGSRGDENHESTEKPSAESAASAESGQNTHSGAETNARSYARKRSKTVAA
jgi:DNA primase catalytic core